MKLERITILVEPAREPLPGTASSAEIRAFDRLDEFAAALAGHAGVAVSIMEDVLRAAPADGMLLVRSSGFEAMMSECPEPLRASIAARTVILNAFRGSVAQLLDRFGFAGAVLDNRYEKWRRNRGEETGSGVRGLRHLAERLGANCGDGTDPTPDERYCMLHSERYLDLPGLLAAYLAAAAELP